MQILFLHAAQLRFKIPLQRLLLRLQVLKLQNQHCLLALGRGQLFLQTGLKLFNLLALGLEFGFCMFLLGLQPGVALLHFALLFLALAAYALLVALHGAFKLRRQVGCLLLGEVNLLVFQRPFAFVVNLPLGEFVFLLFKAILDLAKTGRPVTDALLSVFFRLSQGLV